MTAFEQFRNVMAVVGVGALVYLLRRVIGKDAGRIAGEDGPIRVKGGSIEVYNEALNDWERDDDEVHHEFHLKGRPKSWYVEVWKKEADMGSVKPWTKEGKRATVHVDAGNDFVIKFRPNGGVRVIDKDKRLKVEPKRLYFAEESRIKKVVVKDGVHEHSYAEFDPDKGEKGFVRLTPLF
jgi:hypothetical protein